jgi:hypothetical protein
LSSTTDGKADFSGAAQRLALAGHGRGDARQVALGGGEQVLTLAGALGSERVVAADNQALAGEIGRGNGRHVALVEQRHLQRAGLAQRLDRRGPQGGDPIEPGRAEVLADPGLGDHAAVPDQHDVIKTKACFELGHLAAQGHRVCGAAFEHLGGHGTAVPGAEQTIDDLQFAALAVTAVAELGQRAAAAFQIARRDIVKHQGAAGEVPFGQRRLDRRLAYGQPVEGSVELVLVDHPQTELLAQAGAGGIGRQRAGGGELGAGIDNTVDDESQDEITAAVACGAEQAIKANLARRAERRSDMPMRQRTDNDDALLVLGDDGAAFEQHLETGNPLARPVGQVEQGALFDLAALAVALAQQDGRGRVAIRDRFDVHGDMIAPYLENATTNCQFTWLRFAGDKARKLRSINHLTSAKVGTSV